LPEIADRPTTAAKPLATPALLLAMLSLSSRVSDLIFSPGSFPHVELSGQLRPVKISGQQPLTPDDLRRIAEELIGDNKQAMSMLREQGSCDISYRFPRQVSIQGSMCSCSEEVTPL